MSPSKDSKRSSIKVTASPGGEDHLKLSDEVEYPIFSLSYEKNLRHAKTNKNGADHLSGDFVPGVSAPTRRESMRTQYHAQPPADHDIIIDPGRGTSSVVPDSTRRSSIKVIAPPGGEDHLNFNAATSRTPFSRVVDSVADSPKEVWETKIGRTSNISMAPTSRCPFT